MAEPRMNAAGQQGLTLVEMIVAMALLLGGITALLGLLSVGAETHRSSQAQHRAAWLAQEVFLAIENEDLGNPWLDDSAPEQLPARGPVPVDEVPGMFYTVQFHHDADRPDLVLVEILIRWSEQGEEVSTSFDKLITRSVPFSIRAARLRERRGRGS